MITIVCFIIFILLNLWFFKLLSGNGVEIKLPFNNELLIQCNSHEAMIIAIFATAWIGLSNLLSLRLGFLELFCLLAILTYKNRQPFSFPLVIYFIFITWIIYGISYSPSINFGVRMLLKYLYPFLFALTCAKIVRDGAVFMSSALWARFTGIIGIILILTPVLNHLFTQILWYAAAFITGIITYIIFSLELFFQSDNPAVKKRNLLIALCLCLPCLITVFRTDIYGTAIALSMFFLIKYKLKALPIIAGIGLVGLCTVFFIPQVKEKMFINPDKVTYTDYLDGNIDENNIQTNYRKFMWEDATKNFYIGHELLGSGTGRVQKFFYTEATDARRGGQLHNDFLVLKCDNGMIGLYLYCFAYIAIFLHCFKIYHRYDDKYLKTCSIVAGSALIGIFATSFSDNTVSYSLVTLSAPWGFYGMTLGMKYEIDNA